MVQSLDLSTLDTSMMRLVRQKKIKTCTYVDYPDSHRSTIKIQEYKNFHCAKCRISFNLFPVTTKMTSPSIYVKFFDDIKLGEFDSTKGLKNNDIPKQEKLNNLAINVLEFTSTKNTTNLKQLSYQ